MSMWLWVTIGALLLIAPRLLRLRARHQARANLLRTPLPHLSFSEVAPETVPSAIRDALAQASTDLESLGFQLVGYMQLSELNAPDARTHAVLRHPGELCFAVLAFHLADQRGVTVDFETLFTDGWWLRTVNRRGHFFTTPFDSGRVVDPYVTTIGEQWQHHRQEAALQTTRTRRDAGLAELIVHKNAVEEQEIAGGLKQGLWERIPEGGFRWTHAGADLLIQRLTAAAARTAAAPPVTGVLAMPNPPEELERKFQHILRVQAKTPRRAMRWAFLLSVIAFAASAMLFKQWAWLLWIIPFLLFHELGHWATMRLFGHSDARIRFIPLLGAATLTTTRFRKLSHEMIVLLAGPVPGIALGLVLFQFIDFGRSPYMLSTAITLVVINSLNLLPVHPLDGGRILHALVTAGRPRLDIALKVVAVGLFVAGAIALKDPLLAILAAVGALVLRPGWRLARLDNQIRRQPGFSPALTPEQRRRLIFDALPEQERAGGTGWVQLVQQLEVSLSHGHVRLGQALPWAAFYFGCLGGLVAWGFNVMAAMPRGFRCPPASHAKPLACGASAVVDQIDWSHPEPRTLTRNPFKLVSRPDFPYAAFVWCTGGQRSESQILEDLMPIGGAAEFCPALPWETLPGDGAPQRQAARWTLGLLTAGGWRETPADRLARVERIQSEFGQKGRFDGEMLRLYKTWAQHPRNADAALAVSRRIGRSPGESCKHLRIWNIQTEKSEARSDQGDEVITTRLSVELASPADLAPLHRYLCDVGCAVAVLPYGSMDPRLRMCLEASDFQ